MIQTWIRDQLKPLLPRLTWSIDYERNLDHAGVVYAEGGGPPTGYDIEFRNLRYMVWIESEDWNYAKYAARMVAERFLDDQTVYEIAVEYRDDNGTLLATDEVQLHRIRIAGEPNSLGVEDGRRIYSINLETKIRIKGGSD